MNFGLKGTLAKCLSAVLICTMGSMTTAYAEPINLNSNSSNTNAESFTSSQWSNISKEQLLSNNNNSIFGLAGNFNAFVKNDFYMNGADEEGRLAAGGNVTLTGNGVGAELSMTDKATQSASLIVNGNYSGKNTLIANGFAIVNGQVNAASQDVLKYNNFYSYPDLINFNEQFQKLTGLSSNINNAAQGEIGSQIVIQNPANTSMTISGTIGKVTKAYGQVEFTGTNPVYNIFNINANQYLNANGISDLNFNVPSGSAIIVNVTGKNVDFPNCGISLNGQGLNGHSLSDVGGNPNRIMWNLSGAENVSSRGSVEGSVLAPNANWRQPNKDSAHGDLEGNMIVKSFYSSTGFELHDFFFTGENNGKIRVVKTSTWNNTRIFAGVIFSLYKQESNGSWTLIDKRGFSQAGDMNFINLTKGTYKLVENQTDSSNKLLKEPIILTLPLKSENSIPLIPGTSNNMIKSATNVLGDSKDGYMGTNLNIYNDSIYTPDIPYNTGTLVITKTNTSGKALEGAVFNLYDSNNNLLGTYTTNQNGQITINNIFEGNYYLKEVKAPKGYSIKSTPTDITIVKGQTNNITIVDKTEAIQTGKVIITKFGQDKNPLAGAKIGIFNSAGKEVYSGTTGANGEISTVLPLGNYTYKEITQPEGYTLSDKVGSLDITTSGAIVTGSISDVKITSKVVITKFGQDKNPLVGAKIGIYNAEGKEVYSAITGANGEVSTVLPYGNYTYKELKAPAGYTLSSDIGTLDITTNGAIVTGTIKDSKITSKVVITKFGQDNNPLAGAVIGIYNSANQEIYHATTDAKGQISTILPYGKYTYKELSAPAGYTLSSEIGTLDITINGAIVTGTIKDSKITSKVVITKVGQDNNPLAGAVIGIYNSANKEVYKATTDAKGQISTVLPYGKYTYKELSAPAGYTINSEIGTLDITTNGAIVTGKIKDSKISSKVIITKVGQDNNPLAGAVIGIYNSANKEVYKATTDAKGQISTTLPYGKYTYKELSAPAGYTINSEIGTLDITTNGAIVTGKIKDSKITGKVVITKVGQDNNPLAGAVIGIYNSANQEIYHATTDAKGQISTTLPYGKYTYKELSAPAGYTLSSEIGTLDITTNGAIVTGTIKDSKITSKVIITKVGQDNNPLAGAKIGIYNAEGTEVYSGTTGTNGEISTILPYGKYTYKELSAPAGYTLSSEIGTLDITTNGAIVTGTIKDSKITSKVVITKVGQDNNPLAGAVIGIYNSANKEVYKATTDAKGQISTTLPYGKYTYKELKAPAGYTLNSEVGTLDITTNGAIVTGIIKDSKITGKVVITKVGQDNNPLAGAVIGIYNSANQEIYHATTDAKGQISTTLPYGKYTYKELSAPAGYTLSSEIGTLDITTNGAIVTGTIKDSKITGKVIITKVGQNNNPLAGAEIGIYDSASKEVYSGVTDAKGQISVVLPYGKYTYKELKAPTGYNINLEIGHFEINTNNQVIDNLTIKDSKEIVVIKRGNLQIIKEDKTTDKALQGAKFEILNIKTGKEYTETTGKDGKINLDSIPYGEYIIKEVLAPTGYTLSQEAKVIIDSANVKTVVIKDAQINGTLTITKLNEDKQPLSGATFNILDQNGKVIKSVTTGKDGRVTIPLSYGNYKLVEVKAPTGYELNSNQISFKIDKNGQVIQEKVIDNSIARKVTITKTNVDGEVLAGAVIQIKNAEGKVIFTGTTDKSGQVSIMLPYGKYTYSEVQAPSGYNLNTTVGNIDIDSAGKTINKTIVDTTIKNIERKVVITKENRAGDKLEGAVIEIKNAEGKVFTGITNSEGQVSFNLPLGKYTYSEVKAPTGYTINNIVGKIDINSAGETIYNVIKDTKITSTVTITKTNDEGTPLANAFIEIKNAEGNSVFTGTTNSSGQISTTLAYGDYTYQEVKAPEGYNLNPNIYNFKVETNNQEINLVIKDSKKAVVIQTGKVQITKEDLTTGKPLAGATISIFNANGVQVYSATTGNDGIINTTLPYGTYTYKEVDAPKGYEINKTIGSFTISKDNNNVKAVIKDSKKPVVIETGKVQIIKEDLTTGNPLAGATISIFNANGDEVYSGITGNDGMINTTLPYGTYTYKEVVAPKGYEINKTIGSFTLSENNNNVTAVIKDSKKPVVIETGRVQITKEDLTTGSPLAGATISIFNANGVQVYSATTGSDGIISTTLPYGTYTYKEVDAPNGYEINKTIGTFTLSKDSNNVKAVIKDSKKPVVIKTGRIQITKENQETGNPLAGATISIYNANGDEVYSGITGNDGIISITLPYGTYTYKEVVAPKGYEINKTIGTFTLSKDNNNVKAVILDSKKPVVIETGRIQITKEDQATGNPLAGATISIFNANGVQVYSATTGNDGIISTTLPYGTYTYQEVDAPNGYEINKTIGTFTISKDSNNVKAVIKDSKKPVVIETGKVQITKENQTTGNPLAGATISIFNANGVQVYSGTTGSDGMINTTLPYGTYTYKEVVAPKGYEINKTIGTVTLNKDNNNVEAVIKDKKIPEKQDHPSTNTGNINSGNNGSNQNTSSGNINNGNISSGSTNSGNINNGNTNSGNSGSSDITSSGNISNIIPSNNINKHPSVTTGTCNNSENINTTNKNKENNTSEEIKTLADTGLNLNIDGLAASTLMILGALGIFFIERRKFK